MRAAADRSIRFIFDSVADCYADARPDLPPEAIDAATTAVGLRAGGRVLEIGAGTGQLTAPLCAAGFDVVALEPGPALRARLAARMPRLDVRGETFEDFDTDERFDCVAAANAFHWLEPAFAYARAADLLRPGGAIVLAWDTAYPADQGLLRGLYDEVLRPLGSTFPAEHDEIRVMVERDAAAGRDELRASGRFEEPWWTFLRRRLVYTSSRYVRLAETFGSLASMSAEARKDLRAGLERFLGGQSLELEDIVYVVAARMSEG